MQVVSVVRDFDMYERLVRSNVHMQGAVFTPYDNREENLHITTRYNQFLDSYDYAKEDWFVFCHEDWEVKEDLTALRGFRQELLVWAYWKSVWYADTQKLLESQAHQ